MYIIDKTVSYSKKKKKKKYLVQNFNSAEVKKLWIRGR